MEIVIEILKNNRFDSECDSYTLSNPFHTVPNKGDRLTFRKKGYDVLYVVHDYDTQTITITCI